MPAGQIGLWCFDKEVVVVRHEAEGVADPLVVLYNIGKDIEKPTSIGIVEKDIGSGISPGSDVIDSSGIRDS